MKVKIISLDSACCVIMDMFREIVSDGGSGDYACVCQPAFGGVGTAGIAPF